MARTEGSSFRFHAVAVSGQRRGNIEDGLVQAPDVWQRRSTLVDGWIERRVFGQTSYARTKQHPTWSRYHVDYAIGSPIDFAFPRALLANGVEVVTSRGGRFSLAGAGIELDVVDGYIVRITDPAGFVTHLFDFATPQRVEVPR